MANPSLRLVLVDLLNHAHASAWLALLDSYARDPMGGGMPLADDTRRHLVARLIKRTDFVSFIAFLEDEPVGLINAFEGFSTFKAKPLFNIHDLVVIDKARRQGVARALLAAVAEFARERDCCKLTLEVLSHNTAARAVYREAGFSAYELDPAQGQALFWEMPL